jgi:pimeloyl-ACP methyl ester carboxylesterase
MTADSNPVAQASDSPLDPDRFATHRAELATGATVAYLREGVGGVPLLLVHGYPETRRIWWRNVEPLVAAGFEVIAPDLRGFGDSGLAADGFYDVAAHSMDLHALVHDELGHERCFVAGGDAGGPIAYDLTLRFPGFAPKLCFWNTLAPVLPELYAAAGIPDDEPTGTRATADYFRRQAADADALLAELDTPARRRAWVAAMYGHRLWAAPGSFDAAATDFMTEPFADAQKLRASWGIYESSTGHRPMRDVPRYLEVNPTPTLVLYGPEDHVVPRTFPDRCRVAFTECVGPFVVPGAGHFLQWEAADVFNRALHHFFV